MDTLSEIRRLIRADDKAMDAVARRANHIKIIYGILFGTLLTVASWIIACTLWYSKMEHVAHAVDMIYLKLYGTPMP